MPNIGQLIGSYRLIRWISSDPETSLYLAESTVGDLHRAAIRIANLPNIKESTDKIKEEFDLLEQVQTRYIPKIIENSETHLTRQLSSGVLFSTLLKALREQEFTLSTLLISTIALKCADALWGIHQRIPIYGNLHPDHIVFTPTGGMQLLALGRDLKNYSWLQSPEQVSNDFSDWRADQWGLGIIILSLLLNPDEMVLFEEVPPHDFTQILHKIVLKKQADFHNDRKFVSNKDDLLCRIELLMLSEELLQIAPGNRVEDERLILEALWNIHQQLSKVHRISQQKNTDLISIEHLVEALSSKESLRPQIHSSQELVGQKDTIETKPVAPAQTNQLSHTHQTETNHEAVEVSFDENSSEDLKFNTIDTKSVPDIKIQEDNTDLFEHEDHSLEIKSNSEEPFNEQNNIAIASDNTPSAVNSSDENSDADLSSESDLPQIDVDLTQERSVTLNPSSSSSKTSFSSTAFVSPSLKKNITSNQQLQVETTPNKEPQPQNEPLDTPSKKASSSENTPRKNARKQSTSEAKDTSSKRPPPFSKPPKTSSSESIKENDSSEANAKKSSLLKTSPLETQKEHTQTLTLDIEMPHPQDFESSERPGSDLIASVHKKQEDDKKWTPNVFLSINLILFIVILVLIVVS